MLHFFSNKTAQRVRKKLFLLLALTLAAYLGVRTAGNSTADMAHLVVITNHTWFDDFQDSSGLSFLENIQISANDQLLLADNASVGSAISIPISPPSGVQSWGRLDLTATVPVSTALAVDVLDVSGTPLMHNVPDGGSLAGIDAETHSILKLRATLSSNLVGQTPRLDEWGLTWIPDHPYQVFLPVAVKSSTEPTPPLLGAAIGFTAANDSMFLGHVVHFPSLRKNDAGWTSSFAVQNITAFAATLTLQFFREDGTVVYVADGIPLRPYGTYIASLTDYTALANGSYALVATATEVIVGMVSATHTSGKMAVAYEGVSQGSQQIGISRLYKNSNGWTSRLCLHNLTASAVEVRLDYRAQNGSFTANRLIAIRGNGFNCTNLGQEPLLPSPFMGMAHITADTDLLATVEDVNSQTNNAVGDLGFNPTAGSNTVYIPRCRKHNGWQTGVSLINVDSVAANEVTISYREFDGSIEDTHTYPWSGIEFSFSCPGYPSGIIIIPPPLPPPYHLGSAIVSTNLAKFIASAVDFNTTGTDGLSYAGLSELSNMAYAPNVGSGLDNWHSTLSIQNPNATINPVTVFFYDQAGVLRHKLTADISPYGMSQYDITQLPGLSATYEGSAIISATTTVAILVSKQR